MIISINFKFQTRMKMQKDTMISDNSQNNTLNSLSSDEEYQNQFD